MVEAAELADRGGIVGEALEIGELADRVRNELELARSAEPEPRLARDHARLGLEGPEDLEPGQHPVDRRRCHAEEDDPGA